MQPEMMVCGNHCRICCLQGFLDFLPSAFLRQAFPLLWILVAAGEACGKHGSRLKPSFLFLFLLHVCCCRCCRCIRCDFRGPVKPKKCEVNEGHSRCCAFGNADRWILLGHLGLPHEPAFTQRDVVMVMWSGFPKLHACTVRQVKRQPQDTQSCLVCAGRALKERISFCNCSCYALLWARNCRSSSGQCICFNFLWYLQCARSLLAQCVRAGEMLRSIVVRVAFS